MIRIQIADDNEKVRKDLRVLFELTPAIEVIGEAEDLEQLKSSLVENPPDVLILDLEFGERKGRDENSAEEFSETCEAIRWIKERFSTILIFVLTIYGDVEAKNATMDSGADRFFVKGRDTEELLELLGKLAER